MPTVPFNPLQEVMPVGAVNAEQRIRPAADEALQTLGKTAFNETDKFQQLQNETDANHAFSTQFGDGVRKMRSQYMQNQGKDAVDALPGYMSGLHDLQGNVRDTLNPTSKKMFDLMSRRMMMNEADSMSSYADQQNKQYRNQTHIAMLDNFEKDGADFYNDPKRMATAINSGNAEIDTYSHDLGESPSVAQQRKQDFGSKVWSSSIKMQALHDPMAAYDAYNAHFNDLSPGDRVVLGNELQTRRNAAGGTTLGQSFIAGHGMYDPSDWMDVLKTQGEHGKPGDVSPKGALGPYQMMPGTAQQAAREIGVDYDPERLKTDETYGKMLATKFHNDLIARYGGLQPLVDAAYNAGPGQVDKWLQTIGDPRTGAISAQDWAEKIPFKETRDYVARITSSLKPPTGGGSAIDDVNATSRLKEAADYLKNLDPKNTELSHSVEGTIASYTRQTKEARTSLMAQSTDTVYSGITQLTQSGTPPRSMDDLYRSSPVVADALDSMKREDPPRYQRMSRMLTTEAAHTMTPEGQDEYNRIYGERYTDPVKFYNEDFTSLKGKVPDSYIQGLVKTKAQMNGTKLEAQAVSDTWLPKIKTQLKLANVSLNNDQISTLFGAFKQQAEQVTKNNMSALNDDQGAQLINKLLVQGHERGNYGFFGGLKDVPNYQAKPGSFIINDISHIPAAEVKNLRQAYKANGIDNPKDSDIEDAYTIMQLKLKQNNAK